MAIEARIQALEDEHTIIRGQLKQTLASVRDFLLDLNLPAMQDESSPSEIHEHEEHRQDDNSVVTPPMPNNAPFPQMPPQAGPMPQMPPPPAGMPPAPSAVPQTPQAAPPPPMPFDNPPAMPPQAGPMPEAGMEAPEVVQTAEDETTLTGSNWPPTQPEESAGQEPHPAAGQEMEEVTGGVPGELEGGTPGEMTQSLPEELVKGMPEETNEAIPMEMAEERPEPVGRLEEMPDDEPSPQDNQPCRDEEPCRNEEPCPPEPAVRQPEVRRGTGGSPASQMNLLTNLIRWVSTARRDIGNEQLPVFLDVYSIGEALPDELRDVILYLAGMIAPKPPCREAETTHSADRGLQTEFPLVDVPGIEKAALPPAPGADADTWSRMIMELHGILSLGDAGFIPQQFNYLRKEEPEAPERDTAEEVIMEPVTAEAPPEAAEEVKEKPAETAPETLPEEPPAAPEATGEAEENMEIEVVKKSRAKPKKKRKARAKAAPATENRMARLKLVVPGSGGAEEELSIGEFNLNIGG